MALIWWLEGHGKREKWAGIAAARAEELLSHVWHERKEIRGVYLPHALYLAGLVDIVDGVMRALLLEQVGWCQHILGLYAISVTAN